MTKKQTATIKEVAALAEVSQMTVSRVLNDQSAVKEATRKRVQEAIRELNYRPNIMARNLAGRTGLFIGLMYRNPSYGYLSEFLLGALNACRELGHYLIVEEPFVDHNMVDLDKIERRFLDTNIQALIVVPPLSDDPELIDTLTRSGISFVIISPQWDSFSGLSVGIDDQAAARDMTNYLIGLGHRRIGLIAGPPDHCSSDLRLNGYRDAMSTLGQDIDESIILPGDFTYVSGLKCAEEMLALENPPTAIFACNDDMAAGAIAAANRRGISVPEELSVVGFDDTTNASAMWPPLTTVRQPIRDMARNAIEILESNVATSGNAITKRKLDYELIIRKSTAAPKS